MTLVVQPGGEFADESILQSDRSKTRKLIACLSRHPHLVFEGPSTECQSKQRLKVMPEEGILILKVGSALTFALRKVLFSRELIEQELYEINDMPLSRFRKIPENTILNNSKYWTNYYLGDICHVSFARADSFSDTSRYYLNDTRVQESARILLKKPDTTGVPLAPLSQYLPIQYREIRGALILFALPMCLSII